MRRLHVLPKLGSKIVRLKVWRVKLTRKKKTFTGTIKTEEGETATTKTQSEDPLRANKERGKDNTRRTPILLLKRESRKKRGTFKDGPKWQKSQQVFCRWQENRQRLACPSGEGAKSRGEGKKKRRRLDFEGRGYI